MPELPEVEVTRRSFGPRIEGARITGVRLGKPLRWPLGCDAQSLLGQTVGATTRRGKYLWLPLDRGGPADAPGHVGLAAVLAAAARRRPARTTTSTSSPRAARCA